MRRARATASAAGACLTAAVILGAAAGCTSGGSPAASSAASSGTAAASGSAAALPARALASPACSAATAAGPSLGSAGTTSLQIGGDPFGVAVTPDGRWAFAVTSGSAGSDDAVQALRLPTGPGTAAAPAVTLAGSVALPATPSGPPLGAAVTPDGKYLLVAVGDGAIVLSVARAEAGDSGAVLGTLAAPVAAGLAGAAAASDGAIEVTVSPDSRFAFVSLENAGQVAVFNLAQALAGKFGAAAYLGAIPLGTAPVGLAVSPSGQWLYATSEAADAAQHPVSAGSGGCSGAVPGTEPAERPGTLTVISLQRAETDPARSVAATVDAGYQPVRVITAAGGTQVWVTARASDDLLCFSAASLASAPARALVSVVRVGSEPVGLAAVRGGALIVVADSNRFSAAAAASALSVVKVAAALAGRPAQAGDLATGLFPRDMTVSPGGTLLVSDYDSGQVQAIATAQLPASGS